ncbi:hypothetical protein [Pelagibius marinus]|uniref:hypothetical protein n=1 Tax=Pelagibius marinus TaxID=2762760 RepID=UPI001872B307|nr:hypothetical protein [Pelagibius marinus]
MMEVQKMMLDPEEAQKVQKASAAKVEEFLKPEKTPANVVGMGYGVKWSNGEPTGKPALLALVSQKVDKEELGPNDMIPKKIGEMQTDVLAIGEPFAGQAEPIEVSIELLARRARPASGGYSVGHRNITAGTIGTCVYDMVGTPGNPVGMPQHYYILSNNHVLANSNNATPGDAILQPGPFDGGVDPSDRIAALSRFIPITFDPPVPRPLHRNLIDAAVAEGQFHDLKREIHWVGHLRGWRPRAQVQVGTVLQKTGRTTNYTTGRITAVNTTVDVNYGGGKVARFRDQILTTPMSAGGDSGSLVADRDNFAVGLLFAGSPQVTILNQIQHVRSLLRVEIA